MGSAQFQMRYCLFQKYHWISSLYQKPVQITTETISESEQFVVVKVHKKLFVPAFKPETIVLKFVAEVKIPAPPLTDQIPVPLVGGAAVIVVELVQID